MTLPASNLPRRVPIPLAQRVNDLRYGPLTVVLWLAAAAGAMALLWKREGAHEYVAIAHAPSVEVSSTVSGTLEGVAVALFDTVTAGEVIARFDARDLEADIVVARARLDRGGAALVAAGGRLDVQARTFASEHASDLRRFLLDEVELEYDALRLRVELAADQIEAERLAARHARLQELVADAITSVEDAEDAAGVFRVRFRNDCPV